ncbi:vWA domain-containing protein [Paenibacillus wynnii]|uniref:von Willebrand factor A n=1 Tax=Paenibacillus wynnii TaxID=268407 RepID=A0A098MB18_9BACL|nr:vWA domain-containing protein [Paenibacillus wynnii]KGE19261.1 von Willebrand factor A [Paenibacillus wynnii]
MQRKINLLLLFFSLIGGGIAFVIGEILLTRWLDEIPSILLVGLYFAVVGLGVGLGCLIAEMVSPRLNGASWKQRYLGLSWKLLPIMLVLLFGVGAVTEFVYELNFGGAKPVKDVVLVIDDSGSMMQSDPNNSRYTAAQALVKRMDKDNQVAVLTFSDVASVAQPMTSLANPADIDRVTSAIASLQTTEGGTNISGALSEAMSVINGDEAADRGAMVILLSDGFSEFDTSRELQNYLDRGVKVNTIGLGLDDPSGSYLLQDIATTTGGQYYDVTDANLLGDVFQQIYERLGDRTLLTERTDVTADSPYYAAVRILSLLIIGAALGLGLGIMFDNRYLAKSFGLGGAVSGLIAGLILEFGLSGHSFLNGIIRLIAVLILAGIIALFTVVVPIGEGRISRRGQKGVPSKAPASDHFPNPRRDRSSKGF